MLIAAGCAPPAMPEAPAAAAPVPAGQARIWLKHDFWRDAASLVTIPQVRTKVMPDLLAVAHLTPADLPQPADPTPMPPSGAPITRRLADLIIHLGCSDEACFECERIRALRIGS